MVVKIKKVDYATIDKFHKALCPLYNGKCVRSRCRYNFNHEEIGTIENKIWEKYVASLRRYVKSIDEDMDYAYDVLTCKNVDCLSPKDKIFRTYCEELWNKC